MFNALRTNSTCSHGWILQSIIVSSSLLQSAPCDHFPKRLKAKFKVHCSGIPLPDSFYTASEEVFWHQNISSSFYRSTTTQTFMYPLCLLHHTPTLFSYVVWHINKICYLNCIPFSLYLVWFCYMFLKCAYPFSCLHVFLMGPGA
jgi:hypothetical protein